MEKTTMFSCANCIKKIEASEFPYCEDWIFFHSLRYKEEKDKTKAIVDKHFCSKGCLVEFLDKMLSEGLNPTDFNTKTINVDDIIE